MKVCPKCNIEHNKTGTFCSRSCANSRSFSIETNKKRSESNRNAIKLWSSDKLKEVKRKRISTYRAKRPETRCIECGTLIRAVNKHRMCQTCYFKSDISSYSQGHYRKYHRLSVVDSFGNSVYLMSSLEIRYYKWLTKNNIKWKKPDIVRYHDDKGKSRWYKPDFYLVESDEVIEVKGYWWENDRLKMKWVIEQNPDLKVKVLMKNDLLELELGGKSIRADTSL